MIPHHVYCQLAILGLRHRVHRQLLRVVLQICTFPFCVPCC